MPFHSSQSSKSILRSADRFSSSQYGAIYFTHEPNSTVAPSEMYSAKVTTLCHNRQDPYHQREECALYSGLGYVVRYGTRFIVSVQFVGDLIPAVYSVLSYNSAIILQHFMSRYVSAPLKKADTSVFERSASQRSRRCTCREAVISEASRRSNC